MVGVPALAGPARADDAPPTVRAVTTEPDGAPTGVAPAEPEQTEADRAKARAQALLTQGIDRLQTFEYQAALDFFIGAYAEFQSPKILLNIGATLLELGRHADAANTFQLYIEDPETKVDRLAEVKSRLLQLDEQLVVARIAVEPSGVDVSIDGGPWVPVGLRLTTRLTPGIHMVRGRKDGHAMAEVTLNTFEGETRDVPIKLELAPPPGPGDTSGGGLIDPETPPPPAEDTTAAVAANPLAKVGEPPPDEATAWLVTGAKAERGGVQTATVVDVQQFLPSETEDQDPYFQTYETSYASRLGISLQARSDLRSGAAFGGGIRVDISRRWQLEASMMFSQLPGFYLGARYRILTGKLAPYVAAGEPFFVVGGAPGDTDPNRLRLGVRAAGGLEIRINDHFAVSGELAYEHYFDDSPAEEAPGGFENDYFVPLVSAEGRL
jgi:hypothetical protein